MQYSENNQKVNYCTSISIFFILIDSSGNDFCRETYQFLSEVEVHLQNAEHQQQNLMEICRQIDVTFQQQDAIGREYLGINQESVNNVTRTYQQYKQYQRQYNHQYYKTKQLFKMALWNYETIRQMREETRNMPKCHEAQRKYVIVKKQYIKILQMYARARKKYTEAKEQLKIAKLEYIAAQQIRDLMHQQYEDRVKQTLEAQKNLGIMKQQVYHAIQQVRIKDNQLCQAAEELHVVNYMGIFPLSTFNCMTH